MRNHGTLNFPMHSSAPPVGSESEVYYSALDNTPYISDGATWNPIGSGVSSGSLGWVRPEDYGAEGDGITDDTTAFNNALASISARGGILKLDAKVYLLPNGIEESIEGLLVEGTGLGYNGPGWTDIQGTVIKTTAMGVWCWRHKRNSTNTTMFQGAAFTNVTFEGAVSSTTVATSVVVTTLTGSQSVVLTDASAFPSSGMALLNTNGSLSSKALIKYTGKTSNTLTGCTLLYGEGTAASSNTARCSTAGGLSIETCHSYVEHCFSQNHVAGTCFAWGQLDATASVDTSWHHADHLVAASFGIGFDIGRRTITEATAAGSVVEAGGYYANLVNLQSSTSSTSTGGCGLKITASNVTIIGGKDESSHTGTDIQSVTGVNCIGRRHEDIAVHELRIDRRDAQAFRSRIFVAGSVGSGPIFVGANNSYDVIWGYSGTTPTITDNSGTLCFMGNDGQIIISRNNSEVPIAVKSGSVNVLELYRDGATVGVLRSNAGTGGMLDLRTAGNAGTEQIRVTTLAGTNIARFFGDGKTQIHGQVGFQGTSPIAKPTVTGSKGGNAALASLLTALANYGLITDSTT